MKIYLLSRFLHFSNNSELTKKGCNFGSNLVVEFMLYFSPYYLLSMVMNSRVTFPEFCEYTAFYFIPAFGKNTHMMSSYISMAPFYDSIFSVKQFPFSYLGNCKAAGKKIFEYHQNLIRHQKCFNSCWIL